MSAVFLHSLDFIATADGADNAPASRLSLDEPGLTYRSNGNETIITLDCHAPVEMNAIALIRAKLEPTATIEVQAYNDGSFSDPALFVSQEAWSGIGRDDAAICYVPFPSTVTARYVRVTVRTTRTIVEISRILVGKRIEVDGIDNNPELTHVSGSTVEDGPGWTTVGPQRTRLQWKANVGNVHRSDFYASWAPFLNRTGKHGSFLFIPNTTSDALQQEACLVRHQQDAKTVPVTYSRYRVEMQLFEV